MLRELISRFTDPGTPPPVLSQVSQLSQCSGIFLAKPSSVAKVATVAVAKVENPKIGGTDQTAVECKAASAPGPETGLDWSPWPADDADPDCDGKWAVFDLRDLAKLYGLRVVAAAGRVLVLYPPELQPDLVSYAEGLLDDARPYLRQNMGKLPVLDSAQAVESVKDIMRQHKGLRFTRGDGGSMWPLYPKTWTAGQKAVVQLLWLVAGDALDLDGIMEVDR